MFSSIARGLHRRGIKRIGTGKESPPTRARALTFQPEWI
jgi:hypothetical protein